jgi:hypothetical protein
VSLLRSARIASISRIAAGRVTTALSSST